MVTDTLKMSISLFLEQNTLQVSLWGKQQLLKDQLMRATITLLPDSSLLSVPRHLTITVKTAKMKHCFIWQKSWM